LLKADDAKKIPPVVIAVSLINFLRELISLVLVDRKFWFLPFITKNYETKNIPTNCGDNYLFFMELLNQSTFFTLPAPLIF